MDLHINIGRSGRCGQRARKCLSVAGGLGRHWCRRLAQNLRVVGSATLSPGHREKASRIGRDNPAIFSNVVSKFGGRAPRVPSLAFSISVPVRELSYAEPTFYLRSQAGTFSPNFDISTIIFPFGNMVHLLWTATKPRLIAGLRGQHPASARLSVVAEKC